MHSVAGFGPSDPDGVPDALEGDDEIQVGFHFTFIPPNPRKYYKRLLEYCIAADLEAMLSPAVGDDDEVSLGILSSSHIELINEVALRWRIGQPYRVACFLDIVRQFYERNEVPLECVPEALQNITRVTNEIELDKWAKQDVDYVATIYGNLFSTFLSHLYHTLDGLPQIKPSDLAPYLSILEIVRDSGLLERYDVDVSQRITEIQNQVRDVSARFYGLKLQELQSAPGVNRALPLLLMTDEIEKNSKLLDKRFPEPLLGCVLRIGRSLQGPLSNSSYFCSHLDIVSLMLEVQIPHFLMDLDDSKRRLFEDSMNGPTPDVPIQDIFALYRRTKTLLGMYKAFCPKCAPPLWSEGSPVDLTF